MHMYAKIYEFAASAGSLEGYVYHKENRDALDMKALPIWINNLAGSYDRLPEEARREFQPLCDQTLGRAVRSLQALLGEDHELIGKLGAMIVGDLPRSPDDFEKVKWYQKNGS